MSRKESLPFTVNALLFFRGVGLEARPLKFSILLFSAGKETTYIQKKQTIYPEFNASFDAHLYPGRVLQFVLMEKPQKLIADATIAASDLADKAGQKEQKIVNLWVMFSRFGSAYTSMWPMVN